MGHPAPFNLKMIGIGNEQWGPQYVERYERFRQGYSKRSTRRSRSSQRRASRRATNDFVICGERCAELKADLVDEHYYMAPKWFRDNVATLRQLSALWTEGLCGRIRRAEFRPRVALPENRNDWECAMSEAAFITGLERNADVVVMSSYAPLFGHVDAWQWTPNLIWFDNLRSYGTPSYYVQKMFATNRGSRVLPIENASPGLYASASVDERTGEVILKLVNSDSTNKDVRIVLAGATRVSQTGKSIVLASSDLKVENSLEEPSKVAPVEQQFTANSSEFVSKLAPTSFTVLRIQVR